MMPEHHPHETVVLSFRFLSSLRGHVQAVYQVAWSSDSRMLVSGSADSTLKVFDLSAKKMVVDLPGHADEVSKKFSLSFFRFNF